MPYKVFATSCTLYSYTLNSKYHLLIQYNIFPLYSYNLNFIYNIIYKIRKSASKISTSFKVFTTSFTVYSYIQNPIYNFANLQLSSPHLHYRSLDPLKLLLHIYCIPCPPPNIAYANSTHKASSGPAEAGAPTVCPIF